MCCLLIKLLLKRRHSTVNSRYSSTLTHHCAWVETLWTCRNETKLILLIQCYSHRAEICPIITHDGIFTSDISGINYICIIIPVLSQVSNDGYVSEYVRGIQQLIDEMSSPCGRNAWWRHRCTYLWGHRRLCAHLQNARTYGHAGNLSRFENYEIFMMTSSSGNIFRATGHLCGEFTGHRWIPCTKASDAELWCFLWSAPE